MSKLGALTSISVKKFVCMRCSVGVLSLSGWLDPDAIGALEDRAWNSLANEGGWREVVPHLVDGENSVAHHLCLRVEEGGEDKPRTVAEHQLIADKECLRRRRQ